VCDDDSEGDLDCIYKISTQEEDWVNLTMDGRISWERESSYTSDSDEERAMAESTTRSNNAKLQHDDQIIALRENRDKGATNI